MLLFTLASLAGDLFLQTFPQLPQAKYVFLAASLVIATRIFTNKLPMLLLAFTLGFTYTFIHAHSVLSWTLPKTQEGKPQLITGHIASLPTKNQFSTSFLFAPNHNESLIRLNYHNEEDHIHVGDNRQFLVKLKRIHGVQNPGGFDYEAWSLQKNLRASGSIIKSKHNKLINHHWYRYPVAQCRQYLQQRIEQYAPSSQTAPWLTTLIIGERSGIDQSNWEVLRKTGTNHLMVIAGLHIGIIAGFAHILVTWCWRRVPRLTLRLPAQQAGATAALITAIFYSALAGFSIPTQRACIMLAVFIIASLLRRQIKAWNAWSLAMLMVLLLNPLSVLTESFWLSFGTIALIIYGMSSRLAPSGIWWKWFRVQWVIGAGLMPLTLMLFQECSLVSFIANTIAIPWLGFTILPFCFLSGIFLLFYAPLGQFCLYLADKSLSGLWFVLTWFSHLPISSWHQAVPSVWISITIVVGMVVLLFPAGMPGRWCGIWLLLPLGFFPQAKPENGEIWMTLLDVGQGLATVIQTENHLLIYDTGAKLGTSFDMGESVIVPYLRNIRASKLDMLVVSHGDNDHIGGAQAILQTYPVAQVKTSVPDKIYPLLAETTNHQVDLCLVGQSWHWDGVDFEFLYPSIAELHQGNNSSCVLRVSAKAKTILLTGDIEKPAEELMLERCKNKLAANILVAPHHGSKTSGLPEFVSTVHPDYVLYPIGYRNRYHFPHAGVVQSYTSMHAIQFDTASSGAIRLNISNNEISEPYLYRVAHQHYWFEKNAN